MKEAVEEELILVVSPREARDLMRGKVSERIRLRASVALVVENKEISVLSAVASTFGVPMTTFRSTRRTISVSRPRKVAVWLLRNVCKMSWPHMASVLGRKDHTTMLYAYRACEKDPELLGYAKSIAEMKGWSV